MRDITYCSHTECYYRDCVRHQSHVTTTGPISIADLNDGYCFIPEAAADQAVRDNREELLRAVCRGVQKTNYKCDNPTRAMCDVDGGCRFCDVIVDAVEEVLNSGN